MWMSHGDSVQKLPKGFVRLAHTSNTLEAAIALHDKSFYGVQFHPEVVHSTQGMVLIRTKMIKQIKDDLDTRKKNLYFYKIRYTI